MDRGYNKVKEITAHSLMAPESLNYNHQELYSCYNLVT